MIRIRRNGGFTLLEMVVAIGIFAIIAAISYAALNNFLDTRAHIEEENEKLRRLQTTFVLLEEDLRYAVDRAVRNGFGDAEPVFFGSPDAALAEGEHLRLTTVRPAPGSAKTHQITRVAWRLNDGELSRVTWGVLDRDIDSEEYQRRLMTNVDHVEFTFFSFDGQEQLSTVNEWTGGEALPAGVGVAILLEGEPVFQRIFQVAGGK